MSRNIFISAAASSSTQVLSSGDCTVTDPKLWEVSNENDENSDSFAPKKISVLYRESGNSSAFCWGLDIKGNFLACSGPQIPSRLSMMRKKEPNNNSDDNNNDNNASQKDDNKNNNNDGKTYTKSSSKKRNNKSDSDSDSGHDVYGDDSNSSSSKKSSSDDDDDQSDMYESTGQDGVLHVFDASFSKTLACIEKQQQQEQQESNKTSSATTVTKAKEGKELKDQDAWYYGCNQKFIACPDYLKSFHSGGGSSYHQPGAFNNTSPNPTLLAYESRFLYRKKQQEGENSDDNNSNSNIIASTKKSSARVQIVEIVEEQDNNDNNDSDNNSDKKYSFKFVGNPLALPSDQQFEKKYFSSSSSSSSSSCDEVIPCLYVQNRFKKQQEEAENNNNNNNNNDNFVEENSFEDVDCYDADEKSGDIASIAFSHHGGCSDNSSSSGGSGSASSFSSQEEQVAACFQGKKSEIIVWNVISKKILGVFTKTASQSVARSSSSSSSDDDDDSNSNNHIISFDANTLSYNPRNKFLLMAATHSGILFLDTTPTTQFSVLSCVKWSYDTSHASRGAHRLWHASFSMTDWRYFVCCYEYDGFVRVGKFSEACCALASPSDNKKLVEEIECTCSLHTKNLIKPLESKNKKKMMKEKKEKQEKELDDVDGDENFDSNDEEEEYADEEQKSLDRYLDSSATVTNCVALSPQNDLLVFCCDGGTMILHSAQTGRRLWRGQAQSSHLLFVRFTSDGRYFVTGSQDHSEVCLFENPLVNHRFQKRKCLFLAKEHSSSRSWRAAFEIFNILYLTARFVSPIL